MKKPSQRGQLTFLLAALLTLIMNKAGIAGDNQKYVLAVIPSRPPVTMHVNWSPFVERLGHETGLRLELKIYKTMDQFEQDVANGIPDLAFLHPVQVVAAMQLQGYIPLVRNELPVAGAFVVKNDSPIKSVQQLEGKTIALVGEKNLCRALLDHELRQHLHITVDTIYAGTAANVVKHVILGKTVAGGALDRSFDNLPKELFSKVRIIYSSEKIAPHALVVHPRVPQEVRTTLTETILQMGKDSGYLPLMSPISLDSPVRADYDRDYRGLEQMELHRYFGPIQ